MNEENGKEIQVQENGGFSLQPKDLEEALKLAEIMASSDFVPKDFKGKTGNVLVAVQMGHEVGLKPMAALQNIAVINGRPCIWGDAALAIVKCHPDFVSIVEDDEETIGKNKKAVCKIIRRGQPEVVSTFTVEDATKARLIGKDGPWKTYPNRMLKMRARGFCMRDSFPDALKGLSVREEAEDYVEVEHQILPDPVEKQSNQENLPDVLEISEVKPENPEPKTVVYISDSQREGIEGLIADYDLMELEIQEILSNHGADSLHEITPDKYVPITKDLSAKGQCRNATA